MSTLARITQVWTIMSGGEVAMTSMHLFSTSGTLSDLVTAAEAGKSTLWTSIRPYFHSSTTWSSTKYQAIDISTGKVISTVNAVGSGSAGSAADAPLPPQCAEVVSIRTTTPGPKGRGRFYLPPAGKAYLTATGFIDPTFQSNVTPAYGTWFTGIHGASGAFHIGVYSHKFSAFEDATTIDMGNVFDTQRRRRNKLTEARYSVAV